MTTDTPPAVTAPVACVDRAESRACVAAIQDPAGNAVIRFRLDEAAGAPYPPMPALPAAAPAAGREREERPNWGRLLSIAGPILALIAAALTRRAQKERPPSSVPEPSAPGRPPGASSPRDVRQSEWLRYAVVAMGAGIAIAILFWLAS